MPVVKALQVLENRSPGMLASGPGGAMQELGLKGGEEAFSDGVIPACAWATDGRGYAVLGELADIGRTSRPSTNSISSRCSTASSHSRSP